LPVSLHFEKPPELAAPSTIILRTLERELDVQISEKRRRKAGTNKGGRGGGNEANNEEEKEFIINTYEVGRLDGIIWE
jgi:hypothetical protein